MREDERQPGNDQEDRWRLQIELPAEMVHDFRQWWDSEGYWSFRAWHETNFNPDSEWEQFMRHLCGWAPTKKRPAVCCDPADPIR
jgi:hypothetical protein